MDIELEERTKDLRLLNELKITRARQAYQAAKVRGFMEVSPSFDNFDFKTIDDAQKVWLERDFEEDEVLKAIKCCGANKAPGPDGRADWRLNTSFIRLTLKKEDALTTKDYMPISHISSFYKLISKVLAERMKVVMPQLIPSSQGAFVRQKQILDGILKNGFGERWIRWIRWCVTEAQFSVFFNGAATDIIKPSKGVRQGDTLSPFLFLLVVEVLSLLVSDAKQKGLITGFQVKEGGTTVTHLQFVDDTILMLNASKKEVINLLVLLMIFEVLTGLKLNLEKSPITSIGADDVVGDLALELGCKVDELPITYLGMPIGALRRNKEGWDAVIQKMKKKLAPWKRVFLNKAGRITLIRSALESITTYFMSLLILPVAVEKELNIIMRRFLWGEEGDQRKMSWVSWLKICNLKENGGLGIRNLRLVNKALLAKWHWRYAREKQALWRRIVCEKNRC
ncbi:uncharacterized protein LOC113291698 [Papaver somniferum]|uniref:uncharacterized protein LOC113291698 n=1 Tax=Papaver somniferum TaxID=3469 RepID=UPI000E6F97B2|nr:uncharacterized protein LOC113291698 [Papaver somniferum]